MTFSRFGGAAKGGRAIQDAGVLGKDLNAARDAIANALMGLGESAQPMLRQFARQVGLLPQTGSAGVRIGARSAARPPAPRPSTSAYQAARGLLGGEGRSVPMGRAPGSPAPRPAFGPNAAEAPAQPLIDRLMPISRTAEGMPTAPVAPGAGITPIEGTQLNMFSGMNRLRYPKGTRTADDVAIGGTTYSPNIRMPENEYTQRVRELARTMGLDEDVALEAMRRPGRSLAEEVDFASIQPETGFFRTMQGPDLPPGGVPRRAPRPAFGPNAEVSAPTDIAVDRAFAVGRAGGPNVEDLTVLRDAAGGLRQVNLGRLAPYAGITGIGGLALGTYLYQELNPRVGETTESADPMGIQAPVQLDPGQTLDTLPVSGSPGGGVPPAARTLPGQIGAGSEIIRLSGAREEALNEARQNAEAVSPTRLSKPQQDLLRYYRQREAFAQDPRTQKGILSEFGSMGARFAEEDMAAWAKANPALAYELIEKMKGMRPAPSQQMPQPVQAGPTMTELGSNTRNNSAYNVFAAGQAAVEPTQANADLRDATDPKYVPQQLIGPSSNPGYNMYGYPLVNPYI